MRGFARRIAAQPPFCQKSQQSLGKGTMPIDVKPLAIPEVKLITPPIFRDARGFFSEAYNREALATAGIGAEFVQDNHALSRARGVIRGIHFQIEPHPQGKLVRVVRGATFGVAVDIRGGSPTFGRHVSAVLSPENWAQLWVPALDMPTARSSRTPR
jgi:dTDP-4-dehydrorhamnose 3,5-epimerase